MSQIQKLSSFSNLKWYRKEYFIKMRRFFSSLCQKRKAEIKRVYKLALEFLLPVVWQAKYFH